MNTDLFMPFIFFINLVFSIALMFVPVWFTRSKLRLSWVNPYTITMAISLPFQLMKLVAGPLILIEDGLFDSSYQFAVLMANLQTVVQTLGLVFFLSVFSQCRVDRLLPMQRIILTTRDLTTGKNVFLFVFALSLYFLASAEFGIVNWMLNPREGYQLYRTGQGHWYALAVSALSVSSLLAFLAKLKPSAVLTNTIIFIALGYFLGSKGTMLMIFITGLAILWFLRWQYFARMFVVGVPIVFALLLFNLYLALKDNFNPQSVVEYFDYYKNAADYYEGYLNGKIPLFYGDVVLSSFWSYVPRGFWSDKPTVYGILLVNEIFYPGQAELTNTPAFGGAVEQFADFGVLGVVIFSFFSARSILAALFAYLIFRRPGINFDQVSLATVMLLLVEFVPSFGLYFPSGLYILLLFVVLGTLKTFRKRRRPRAMRSPQ